MAVTSLRIAPPPGSCSATAGMLAPIPDRAPARLGRELDQLEVAIRLGVPEGVGVLVEDHLELALHHALVEPGAAEDEPADPVDERALRGAVEVAPAVVDVLAQLGLRLVHLAVDREVHEVLALVVAEGAVHEAELRGRLLHALGEVTLVEREPKLAVLQH